MGSKKTPSFDGGVESIHTIVYVCEYAIDRSIV